MSDLQKALSVIQQSLNAPKNQYNSFGKYNYRNCEDILMALKPLLGECVLVINDEVVAVGDRIYVKATATIKLGNDSESATAYARESLTKKGMDDGQITGSTSSYARKYALNGLLLIDDNKDADSQKPPVSSAAPAKTNPDVDLILDAIKRNDDGFVKQNWTGVIAAQWGNLPPASTETLNKMYNH